MSRGPHCGRVCELRAVKVSWADKDGGGMLCTGERTNKERIKQERDRVNERMNRVWRGREQDMCNDEAGLETNALGTGRIPTRGRRWADADARPRSEGPTMTRARQRQKRNKADKLAWSPRSGGRDQGTKQHPLVRPQLSTAEAKCLKVIKMRQDHRHQPICHPSGSG